MKSSKLKSLFLLTAGLTLASCSTTPPAKVETPQPPVVQPSKEDEPEIEVLKPEQSFSAYDLLRQAEQGQGLMQQQNLLQAAKAHLAQGQVNEALAIHQALHKYAEPAVKQQNLLPWFASLIAKGQISTIEKFLTQFPVTQFANADKQAYLQLQADYFSEQQPLQAARAYLLLLQQEPKDNAAQLALWRQLGLLTPLQLETLTKSNDPSTQGWATLQQTYQRFLGDSNALTEALAQWQNRYGRLPALMQLPAQIRSLDTFESYQPQKIAVLLPFNSNFRQHAEAIQQGILAASVQHPAHLIFIDSQQSAEALKLKLQQEKIDFVIGPLLKEQVDNLAKDPSWLVPTLFLNSRTEQINTADQKFYFSLNVEDEARQMALLFRQKGYQRPVLIASKNALSQRMVTQFNREWQKMTGGTPENYWVTDMPSMQKTVKQMLETAASEQRIKDIENASDEDVSAEPHSRRDIEAIYLLADPAQTRLLKPFIDVSVAPSALSLPIYASSRSHQKSAELTDRRDLLNLTLTEMPWMLNQQQQQAFRDEYNSLFPEQDETLQRLFAMGYDAFHLVFKLKQQKEYPELPHSGLTGQLRLSADGQVQRELNYAKYSKTHLNTLSTP